MAYGHFTTRQRVRASCIGADRGLTGKGMGGVTGEGRLRAGDWLGRCGGECCGCPEVEEQVEPGDGTEVCCWLGGVM